MSDTPDPGLTEPLEEDDLDVFRHMPVGTGDPNIVAPEDNEIEEVETDEGEDD